MKTLCLVCQNVDCKNRGAEQLMSELQKRVEAKGLPDVEVKSYMCFGACQEGPNIVLYPEKSWYAGVKTKISMRLPITLPAGHVSTLDTIDSWWGSLPTS